MAPKIVVSRWPATVAAGEASPVLVMLEMSRYHKMTERMGERLEEIKGTLAGRNIFDEY